MRRLFSIIAVAIILLMQCGCYDSREIDETAYIIAIGIDPNDEGFNYTFQLALPLATSSEGGGEGDKVLNTTVPAKDFYIARNMLNNSLSKAVDMSHLKMIVFSQGLGKSDFARHSRLLHREREVRPHTLVAVTEGTAEEFLRSINPQLERNTAKFYELLSLHSNNIYAPSKTLGNFLDELTLNGCSALPLAVSNKSEGTQFRGMVLFRNGDAVGTFDADSALIYNILRRDIKNFTVTIESRRAKGQLLTFNVILPSRARFTTDGDKIGVLQDMEATFFEDSLPEGYSSQNELMSDFCTVMEGKITHFMKDTAKLGADIMQTESELKKKCLTLKEWQTRKAEFEYKNVGFYAEVNIR